MRTFHNNFYEEPENRSFARTNFSRVYSVRSGVRGGGVLDTPRNNLAIMTTVAAVAVLVLCVLTLALGARVSSFDYQISEQEQAVSELNQKRAELVLKNAKTASYNNVQNSNLAQAMTR
ncbi:MAG: hypothetical protein LBM12_01450 [Candidatus Nomurabacteria bacterium]|jgi:uncharacterized coiled-coil protein SlyX|nr:hypothetical protein [Candidatus Nomurabacteria bacterium]